MEVAQLYASLKLDSSQYNAGITGAKRGMSETGKAADDAQKSMSGLEGSLGRIGGLMAAAFSFEALRRGAGTLIKTANDMEQYRMRLRAVIETQREADATFLRIKDWAAINPVNTDEAVESFVLLKAAAVDNTEGAIKAIGNLAKVMGRDMRDVSMALVGFNTMQMRRLGILVDQQGAKATIQIGKLRREVDKDIGVMRQNLIEMIEESYGRGMEMSKGTYQGILDTIGGQISNFKLDLAGLDDDSPFRNIINYLNELSTSFDKWMQSAEYKEFIKNFQDIAVALLEASKSILSFSADMVSSDIGTQLLKWGVGLKVATWGFGKIVGMGKGLAGALGAAGAKGTALISTLGEISTVHPWFLTTFGGPAAAGVAAGAAALSVMDKSAAGSETLSERRGLGTNDWGKSFEIQTARAKKVIQDAKKVLTPEVKALMEGINKEIAPYLAEQGDDIGKLAVKEAEKIAGEKIAAREAALKKEEELSKANRPISEKILDPVNEAIRMAIPKFDQASDMVKRFGLDSDRVFNETADLVKEEMKSILDDVIKTYGPGGIMVMAEKLREFDKAVPGLGKVANAIEGIKNEAKSAKDQLSDLNSEMSGLTGPIGKVIKALKQGLFPKDTFAEIKTYLEQNLGKTVETMQKALALEFPGLSKKARGALATSGQRETLESLGMTRMATPAGTIGTARNQQVQVDLSDRAIKNLADAQGKKGAQGANITINQYGFNVQNQMDARKMGRLSAEGARLGFAGAQ